MFDEEYDRLAWGLVKEEIRHLVKPRNNETIQNIAGRILKPGIEIKGQPSGFYIDGTLSNKRLIEVQNQIEANIREKFSPFREIEMRAKLGPEFGFAQAKTYQFWNLSERRVTNNVDEEDETQHNEMMLDLYQITTSVNRKKLVGDLTSCFVLLGQHALYRMIQRGAVDREPLKHLSDNLFDWKRHVAHYLFSFASSGGSIGERFFIPYANGALLCQIGKTHRFEGPGGCTLERLRYQDGVQRSWASQPPYRPYLEALGGPEAHYTFKIATWVPETYVSTEQFWARDRVMELDDKYHRMFSSFTWLLMPFYTVASKNKSSEKQEALESVHEYRKELLAIVSDPRWAIATGLI